MNPCVSAAFVAGLAMVAADARRPIAVDVIGGPASYVVAKGDTWTGIGARFGIEPPALAALNNRTPAARLVAGSSIVIDTRHLVPGAVDDGITINIPQRMLFVRRDGRTMAAFPIGLGRPDWPTFTGPFSIMAMETDPVWDVPPSIQAEQQRSGKPVLRQVDPGPNNPLGKYWLGLSAGGFGIHGTNAPSSIYHFQTHGCIRLHPDDIAALFARVSVGMGGEAIYEPVLIAATVHDVLVEAHRDIYRRFGERDEQMVLQAADELGVTDRIDREALRRVLRARDGRVHSVMRDAGPR